MHMFANDQKNAKQKIKKKQKDKTAKFQWDPFKTKTKTRRKGWEEEKRRTKLLYILANYGVLFV